MAVLEERSATTAIAKNNFILEVKPNTQTKESLPGWGPNMFY